MATEPHDSYLEYVLGFQFPIKFICGIAVLSVLIFH